jgi:hypothetical protein
MGFNPESTRWHDIFQPGTKLLWPAILTDKEWQKTKGLAAKAVTTGVGAALLKAEKVFPKFKSEGEKLCVECPSESDVESFLKSGDLEALRKALKGIKTAAGDAAKTYAKSALTKAALTASKDIEKAADLLGVMINQNSLGTYANTALAKARKIQGSINSRSQALKNEIGNIKTYRGYLVAALDLAKKSDDKKANTCVTLIEGNIKKIDTFVSDINTLAGKPNLDNFFKLATGDGGARGYCTSLKGWDQLYSKSIPGIDGVFKGSAMGSYFAAVQDYGANYNEAKWQGILSK